MPNAPHPADALLAAAVLATGVVYGTDAFFALVGRSTRASPPRPARAWQRRWDGVIVPRAALLMLATGVLATAALAR